MQAAQQAVAAGESATRTSEEPFNAWYSLSALRASQNDAAGAEQCLRAAIAAHPNWFKPHWTLAQILRLEGRRDEALREAAIALDLDGGKNPEVASSLKGLDAP
jgi:tetratricopeptide (TPR) repeat protein